MQEQRTPAADCGNTWRKILDHALANPQLTLVLADTNGKGAAALAVRCQRPRDLLNLAFMLVDQAQDLLEDSTDADVEALREIAEEVLDLRPDPDDRDDAEG